MLSEKRTEVLDITKQIRDIMLSADIKEGILLVNALHTTCALFVNEFQGALVEDLKAMVERHVAPARGPARPQRRRRHHRRRAGPRSLPVDSLRRAGRPATPHHRRADH